MIPELTDDSSTSGESEGSEIKISYTSLISLLVNKRFGSMESARISTSSESPKSLILSGIFGFGTASSTGLKPVLS